jgi:NRPS condensation-like uncharacterized protein
MTACQSATLHSRQNECKLMPLPLAPMEEYLLLDESPAFPMNFFGRFRFSGHFDRAVFESVLSDVVARNPLLSAIILERRPGCVEWIESKYSGPVVRWLSLEASRDELQYSAIDIRSECGLRLFIIEEEKTTELVTQTHHACCDGLGGLYFIEDLLTAYTLAMGKGSKKTVMRPLDKKLLLRRATFGLTPWKFLRMAHKQAVGLLGARQFLMRSPAPLIPHEPAHPAETLPENYPLAVTRRLDRAATSALRRAAREAGVTQNDFLLRDLFLAMDHWRKKYNIGNSSDWLRLSVPINLRTAKDRQMPTANLVSMIFLDRRPAQFGSPKHLLKTINAEMDLIKRLQLGLTFVLSLSVLRKIPGIIKRMVRADRCRATAVMTNLGRVFTHLPLPRSDGRIVAANVVLEGIELIAPIHPYTCASLAVFIYAHRLYVTLHYDPRVMSSNRAEDLIDTYMDFLQATAQSSSKQIQTQSSANK